MKLPTSLRAHERAFIHQVEALVLEQLRASSLSVGSIAELLGLNTQQFRRRIQSMLGMSAMAFITEVRLDHAKHLLIGSPNLSVQEISMQCGFAEPGNFIRAFRLKTGTTPLAYREQFLK